MTTLPTTGKLPRGVVPCKGPCGRLTRTKGMSTIEGLPTIVREGRGMCFTDYKATLQAEAKAAGRRVTKYALAQCTRPGCEALTRHQYEPKHNAEGLGTRRRMEDGTCFVCYKKGEDVPSEVVENARRGLESFLARRQARLQRLERLARVQRTYGLAS